jgi:mycoredoxin
MNRQLRNFLILSGFIGGILLINNWWKIELFLNPIDTQSLADQQIIMYSTSWCPYCAKARQFLQQANIPFEERDIEKSAQAEAEHRAIGGVGIPVLKINQHVINGFDPQIIRNAIENP